MGSEDRLKISLEMAEALDEMDKTLSTDNADFLERVLKLLGNGKPISGRDETKLESLYKRYFGDEETEEGADEEKPANDNGDDDIDEDDFV